MKTEILSALTEALEQENLASIVELGKPAFDQYNILSKHQEEFFKNLPSEGENEETILKKEDIDFLIDEMAVVFQTKLSKYQSEKRKEEQRANLRLKEAIIEELRTLISEEENIGKAFNTFNNIQDKWKTVGEVPSDAYHRIQSEYSRLRESFYYNIKIYKELADHDKKRNQDRKSEIIEQVKLLTKEPSINKQNNKIRELIKEWDNIGITYEESWNTLREEFWTNARSILNRVDNHYNDLREKAHQKLSEKKVLIEKAKKILAFDHRTSSQWRKSTDGIIQLQKDWKKIGLSDRNEEIWIEFRKECDHFFKNKKEFYDKLTKANLEVEERKKELIRQAEILKDSDDWKETTKAILRLQDDWKKAGSTNPKKENILWKIFRGHLDHYFNQKSKFFAGKEDREKDNLQKKENLLKELEAYALTGNVGADVAALKEFSHRWQDIGFVPFKQKDSIHSKYKAILDSKYDKLKLDKSERSKIRIQSKIEHIKDQKNPDKALDYEKRKIRKQIDELKSSILQRENNLGFFNTSKGGSSMLDSINKKLKRDKDRIEELKQMLRQLSKA